MSERDDVGGESLACVAGEEARHAWPAGWPDPAECRLALTPDGDLRPTTAKGESGLSRRRTHER